MEARLKKIENLNKIRIPNHFLKSLNIKINDKLEIKKISLKERFEKYNGENLAKDFSWDDVKGKEIW